MISLRLLCRAVPCFASVHCSHAIVSSAVGPEYYVGITSFVDKTQLEPGCSVLLHNKVIAGWRIKTACCPAAVGSVLLALSNTRPSGLLALHITRPSVQSGSWLLCSLPDQLCIPECISKCVPASLSRRCADGWLLLFLCPFLRVILVHAGHVSGWHPAR